LVEGTGLPVYPKVGARFIELGYSGADESAPYPKSHCGNLNLHLVPVFSIGQSVNWSIGKLTNE